MESERDAYRVIEILDGAWIYGAYIRVSMARNDRRETFWRRKRHQVSQSMSRPIDRENTKIPGSFTKGPIRKRVVGVVDENNVDILPCSAIGRSLRATTLSKLSGMVGGVPIQAWSKHTFKNIAEVWGSLVYIDKDTSAPISFEQGCILIETDVINRIEDVVELVVNGRLYPMRVQEMNPYSGLKWTRMRMRIGIEKTLIETAGVVEESSTTDKLIVNKQDLLELMRRLDLKVIDCSDNVTDEDRIEVENKLKKRGRGRPQNNQKCQCVANVSLSDSDFKNRKKVILRETRETIALGKLIGGMIAAV
ncbi:hypothetical protein V6N13_010106 [Hibiscus sabdariffa]